MWYIPYIKRYIPLGIMTFLLLLVNRVYLFPKEIFSPDVYLAKILCLMLIVFAMLSNASYYSNRANIEREYILFTTLSLTVLLGVLYALGCVLMYSEFCWYDIGFFFSSGRFLFILGLLPFYKKESLIRMLSQTRNIIIGSFILFFAQRILWYLLTLGAFPVNQILFLMDSIGAVFLFWFLMHSLQHKALENVIREYSGFIVLFVAQVYFAVMPYTLEVFIQGFIMITTGAGFWTIHLNTINSTIPQRESQRLQKQFNLYAKNLKKIIDKKTIELRQINNQFIHELDHAKKIQQSLLPDTPRHYRDIQVFSGYFPCERLSGDFYDLNLLDEDHLGLYLMDVSGHGLSAALMTMYSKNYLKSSDVNLQLYRGLNPDILLKHFYDQFNTMNIPDEMHMVLFYATLHLSKNELTYCSGGMNCSPIRFKRDGRYEYLESSKGFPICQLSGFFTPEFKSATIQLEKGDRLIFYTDGLVDEEKNKVFSSESLIHFFNEKKHLPIRKVQDLLSARIEMKKDILEDDITYILVEI